MRHPVKNAALVLAASLSLPAPWHVDEKEISRLSARPASTNEALPIEPGMITGWPTSR